MTTPITPPEVIQPSPWPALGSPNYNAEAYAAGTSLPTAFSRLGALAENVAINAQIGHDNAGLASSAAEAASGAQASALAASNFKGHWAGMAGALNKPACVKHNGRFWLLLNNLANVAASEPGVSSDWTSLDSGTGVTQVVATPSVTVNAVSGVCYVIAAAGVTLVYPATGQVKRDYIGIRLAAAPGTQTIDFNGHKFRGQAAGQRTINVAALELDTYYEDVTRGYI